MRSLFLAAAMVVTPASGTPPLPPPPPPKAPLTVPKLVIAISVDQLSADLFQAYRPHFTGGFKRLADGGVTFVNGYQSHAATETCPGHSTLLTGRHPTATGIVANSWFDPRAARADKNVYCAEDERVPGSTSKDYTVSPEHLRVSTLGDRLKAVSPQSRNVAVAGKDRAAVMMGGRAVDQRWYWDGKTWSTDLKGMTVPRSVEALRTAFAAQVAAGDPGLEPPALCQARATPFAVSPTLSVGNGRLARSAGDARAIRATPALDGATLALAAALTRELGLGRQSASDVLAIGLSATDYVGHSYGWGGQEMCLQMLSLDRELGDFLARMDSTGIDYAVVLSADHGGMDIPERLRAAGNAAAERADPALAPDELGKLIAPQVGRQGSVLVGEGIGGDVWLDPAIPAADRAKVLAAAVQRYRSHRQVQAVFTAAEIAATPVSSADPKSWSLIERVRASFDPARSGDFYVILKEWVSPIVKPGAGYVATHGTAWDHDRRVPIIFWRRGTPAMTLPFTADTTDILPTVASWVQLPIETGSVSGRCRVEAAGCR